MERYQYVSFSSAGTRGVAYGGVLDAVEEVLGEARYQSWRAGIRGVAGCSAGAVCSLMLAVGLSRKKRRDLILRYDMHTVMRTPDLAMLWQQFGITECTGLREIVQDVLTQGGLSALSTFGDLRRLLRIDYTCVASDVATSRPVHFSAASTPDVLVCDAVAASCCVPVAFRPFAIDGRFYVDGALTCHTPNVFDPTQTLFVCIDGHPSDPMCGWISYLGALMRCASQNQRETDEVSAHRVLRIDFSDQPVFDVHMDEARMVDALKHGYVHAVDFFTHGRLLKTLHLACSLHVWARHHSRAVSDDEAPPA